MKSTFLTIVSAGCLAVSLACVIWYSLGASPSAQNADFAIYPSAIKDLGVVRQHTSSDFFFDLRNRSEETIRIVDVATSCTCTTTKVTASQIKNGESSRISLRYDTGHSRGKQNVEAKVVYQRYRDPTYRSLVLKATATIDPDIRLSTDRLQFSQNASGTIELKVWPRDGNDLAINRVVCDKTFLTARLVSSEPTGRHTVAVSFRPEAYYDEAGEARVAIHTSDARNPVVFVPVTIGDPN